MKKKIVVSIFLLLTCITLTMNLEKSQAKEANVTMQNIEVLTNSETTSNACYGVGSLDCPYSKNKVLYII